MLEENGRHEETRTPDLYRVKACGYLFTTTYKALGNCQPRVNTCNYVEVRTVLGEILGDRDATAKVIDRDTGCQPISLNNKAGSR